MDSDQMDYVMHNAEPPSTPQSHRPRQGCPAWRPDHGAFLPSPHGMISPTRNPHSPYDPVHGSSAAWFPQHPFQWSPPTGPAAQPRSAHSDPYFNPMNTALGGPAGPIQPGFLPMPPYPAPLDPFGPLHFSHRGSHQRPGAPNLPNPSGQLGPSGQPSFSPERHTQAPPLRGVGLSPVNFSLPQLQPQTQPSMSSSGDSSSSSSTPERRPPFTSAPDSSRGPNRAGGSFTTSPPSLRSLSSHRHDSAPQPLRSPPRYAEPPIANSDTAPPVPPNSERPRRVPPTRHREIRMSHVYPPNSDGDSEDDLEHFHEREARLLEQYSSGATPYPIRVADGGERQVRAHQLLRGQMTSKRVASKSAISSLQSVEIDTLPESERTCVICYNEFGVPNPEGINEAPLRLPKCKHVFGDHCIKKWFEESDSCPYCRDKVPSEPQVRATPEAIRSFFRQAQRMSAEHGGSAAQRSESEWMRGAGGAEVFATLMNHRNVMLGIDIGSTPSRPLHATGRRSPPDDSSESRRRTRARHGSLRGSPSSSTAGVSGSTSGSNSNNGSSGGSRPNSFAGSSAASHQQSPVRERFMPPHLQNLWQQSSPHQNGPVRRSLTPHIPRQFTGAYGQHHRPHHGQHSSGASHPRHPSTSSPAMGPFAPMPFDASPNTPPFMPPAPAVGGENQPFSNSLSNGNAPLSQREPGPFSTALPAFSQQLPPVGGDGPSVPNFPGMSASHGSQTSY